MIYVFDLGLPHERLLVAESQSFDHKLLGIVGQQVG